MPATIWKGHLSFGLVSIPIKLIRAARAEKVSFRQLYRTSGPAPAEAPEPQRLQAAPANRKLVSMPPPRQPEIETVEPVRQTLITRDEEEPVERSSIVKGYEYEKDRYVVIDPEDLKRLVPETGREMQILEFVKLEEIDPIYFESSYYAIPDKGGERTYALLYEALRQAGYVGLAEVAMQRREHIMVVRPGRTGLILHTMFYNSEIHSEDEYRTDTSAVAPKELELAQLLIRNFAGPFEPAKYRDKYKERVEELIAAKLEGREIAQTPSAPPAPARNIMAALQESLAAAAAKKPAQAEVRKSRKTTRRSSA